MIHFENTSPRIAVLRALQLGDMLCSIPAIRALRTALPSAEIILLGLPWAASYVQRFNKYFDGLIHFPGYPGLPEQSYSDTEWTKFKNKIQREKFDLVIQMQGNGTVVNPMLQTLGIKQLAGFHTAGSRVNPDTFIDYPGHLHEIERHLVLMEHLGFPSQGKHLEFSLSENDYHDFKALLLPITTKHYVVVHPGSRGIQRQWPPPYFAALADYCIEQGFTVVLTGISDEIDITREVKKSMKHTPIDLTGKTNLGAVALLIKNAAFLISNCTGVSHIASALQTRSLVISMDGEPDRWAPLNKNLHKVLDWTTDPHFEKAFNHTVTLLQESHAETTNFTAV